MSIVESFHGKSLAHSNFPFLMNTFSVFLSEERTRVLRHIKRSLSHSNKLEFGVYLNVIEIGLRWLLSS